MNRKIAEVHHFVGTYLRENQCFRVERSHVRAQLTKRQGSSANERQSLIGARDSLEPARSPEPRGASLEPRPPRFPHYFRIGKNQSSPSYAASANKQIIQQPPPIQMSTDTTASGMRSRREAERGPGANKRPPMCLQEFVAMFIECDACSQSKYFVKFSNRWAIETVTLLHGFMICFSGFVNE